MCLMILSDAAEREAYNAAERNERKQHTKEKVLICPLEPFFHIYQVHGIILRFSESYLSASAVLHYIYKSKCVASLNQLFSQKVFKFVVYG